MKLCMQMFMLKYTYKTKGRTGRENINNCLCFTNTQHILGLKPYTGTILIHTYKTLHNGTFSQKDY